MTNTAAMNILAELLDELDDYHHTKRPDLQIWLDIHSLAATMCKQLNEAEAPKPTDA